MKKILCCFVALILASAFVVPALASEQAPVFDARFELVANDPDVETDEWDIEYNVWKPIPADTAIAVGDTVTMMLSYKVPASVEEYDERLLGCIELATEISGIESMELVEAQGCDLLLNCDYDTGVCVPVPGEYENVIHEGTTLKVMAELGDDVKIIVRGTATAVPVTGSLRLTIGQHKFPAYFNEIVVDKLEGNGYSVHWSDFQKVQKRAVDFRADESGAFKTYVAKNGHYHLLETDGSAITAFLPVDENFAVNGEAIDASGELFATLSEIYGIVKDLFGITLEQTSFTDETFIGDGTHHSFEYPYSFGNQNAAPATDAPASAAPASAAPATTAPTASPAPGAPATGAIGFAIFGAIAVISGCSAAVFHKKEK